MVYDLYGEFKRSLPYNEHFRIDNIYDFNEDELICEITPSSETTDKSKFAILSKLNGEVNNKIQLPYKKKKSTKIKGPNNLFTMYHYSPILPFHENWILTRRIGRHCVLSYSQA